MKYPQEKMWDWRNTHEKKFWTHESMIAQWHETHETPDGTRPTEFSTLSEKLCRSHLYLIYFFLSSPLTWNWIIVSFELLSLWLYESRDFEIGSFCQNGFFIYFRWVREWIVLSAALLVLKYFNLKRKQFFIY